MIHSWWLWWAAWESWQGAIWSGAGMGTANKLLEPETGAVWAKIIILVLVVAFIQRKPSGLFPAKGRLADV